MQNKKISDMFERIADILEILGEFPFKVNAYRRACWIISELQDDTEILWRDKKFRELPGTWDALVKTIGEFLTTGFPVKIIAHPTGRLISRREVCQVDLKEVFKEAVQTKNRAGNQRVSGSA